MANSDELGEDGSIELIDVFDKSKDALEGAAEAAGAFYSEWRQFALRKNVFDVTLGIMIGTSLTNIATSLSKDILNPLIISSWSGSNTEDMFVVLKEGKAKCSDCYSTLLQAQDDGAVTLNYGNFIDTVTSFIFTTLFLFGLYKFLCSLKKRVEEEFKEETKKKIATAKGASQT